MGGGAVSGSGGMFGDGLDAKVIGAIFAATFAVGTAIAVMCTPMETLSRILPGEAQMKTKTSCGDSEIITFKDAVPCVNISKRMSKCLEDNCYDIKKCIAYFDLLKECEKS